MATFKLFAYSSSTFRIPSSNLHYPKRSSLNNPHSKIIIFNPNHHSFLSFHLPYFKFQTRLSTVNVDFSVESDRYGVKRLLRELGECWEILNVIDAIQRLGIEHHYKEEIDSILERHHKVLYSNFDNEIIDLHKVALRFRLLRQRGYYVPPEVFEVFMDKEGNFDKELKEDINGLMSLYEASQLCMKGEEDILEKAQTFTKQTLYEKAKNLDQNLARFVHNTLAHPQHKSISTFMVRNYFGETKWTNQWIGILQQVAKMDFKETQALRQKEIIRFSQWWKESGLAEESKFARHKPLAWYANALALTDPCFSEERVLIAKSISFIYIIDDIYDVYGTLSDLTIFTEAVCRWDMAGTENLPECMKFCFAVLNEITNEISNIVNQKHGYNPVESLRKEWKKLLKAFLMEAKWFKSGNLPNAKEYLENGIVSSGVPMALVHAFFLLGQGIKEETVELLDSHPDIISSSAMILRLWDDLGTAKDEGQDGHDGSYVEYYMKEHKNISFEDTKKHIENMISNAWKTLNRESLISISNPLFPPKFVEVSLNVARMVTIVYNYDRDESLPSFEKLIKSLLFLGVD